MKKIIILLCAFLGTLHIHAEDDVPAILFFHNDSIFQSFLRSDVDSMRYSFIDINGEKQNEIATQLVYLKDTVIQIPLAEIDSVVYTPPSYSDELYLKVTNELHDYIYSHENATIKDVQSQLKKYSSSVSSEVRSGILYVLIGDDYEYMCDLDRVTCPDVDGGTVFEDADIDSMLADIKEALYPNDESNSKTRVDNTEPVSMPIKALSRASTSNDVVYLTRKNFYVWSPWPGIKTVTTTNPSEEKGSTLSDLGKIKDYSIALIVCHGDEKGCIGVPNTDNYLLELKQKGLVGGKKGNNKDFHEGTVGKGQSATKSLVLHKSALEKFLTGDLSKTIIWTAMCFANVNGSVLKSVAKSRGDVAYAGANNTYFLVGGLGQNGAKALVDQFYKYPRYAEHYVKDGFKAESERSPISQEYNIEYEDKYLDENNKEVKEVKRIKGVYSFEYDKHFYYKPTTTAMSAIDNQPRASVTMPNELFSMYHSAIATRGFDFTRASSEANISVGFWIRNKQTNEVVEIEFGNSTVKRYENDYNPSFYPKSGNDDKEIARIELLGITDDLREGTYEYRTYLEIDGEKEYSEEMYEFTISDELNVYTDPNFGFPCIDGFADCSSLIGKNYSEMVEILKGHVKLKGKGSLRSKYISDFYFAPYGELTISISNTTQKIGSVEQHFSYSSDFREPDKILRYLKSRYYLYDYDGGGGYWFHDDRDPEKVTITIYLTTSGRSVLYNSVEWLKEEAEWINEHYSDANN